MASKTLFYSWQSDLDKKQNNYFIRDCLEAALKTISKEIELEISLERDTEKASGSPDIVDTIFRKIRMADIFVADVTVINNDYPGRKMPNPNVMMELGYAVRTLGWERIICVVNSDICRLEDLPFDIRNNRTSTYKKLPSVKETASAFTGTMVNAIRAIFDNYSGIVERFTKDSYLDHDKTLFYKFDAICSQTDVFDTTDFLCTTLSLNESHYRVWHSVRSFASAFENHFMDGVIQENFLGFTLLLARLSLFAATKLFLQNRTDMLYASDFEKRGITISPEIQLEIDQTHWYRLPDFMEIRSDDIVAYDARVQTTQEEFNRQADEVQAAYKKFRISIKTHLFI